MSKIIPFFDLFSDYIPERDLRILLMEVMIEEAVINKEELTMSIKLISEEELPTGAIEKIEAQMCCLYGLNQVHIEHRIVVPEIKKKPVVQTEQRQSYRKDGATSAASTDESVIMGGPITANIVPMSGLSLKMPTFAITGQVFAEETYETRRPGVWCMSFDMTDNKSSVRVIKYLKDKEIEAIKGKNQCWYVSYGSGAHEADA